MITKTQLREIVAFLQSEGCDISIQWAYGRPRCYDLSGSRDLSPRLPTGQMALWLDGYETGLKQGIRLEIKAEDIR